MCIFYLFSILFILFILLLSCLNCCQFCSYCNLSKIEHSKWWVWMIDMKYCTIFQCSVINCATIQSFFWFEGNWLTFLFHDTSQYFKNIYNPKFNVFHILFILYCNQNIIQSKILYYNYSKKQRLSTLLLNLATKIALSCCRRGQCR